MGNGLGIASFIIGIIICILNFLVIPPLVYIGITTGSTGILIFLAILGLVILILAITGLILGIIGAATAESKTFALIGLILCVIGLVFILSAMLVGVSMAT